MPLSTSNFEPRSSRSLQYVVAVLVALVVGQVALEVAANWVLRRYGKNEIRWAEERKAADALVHDGKGVMLIGSSVLLGVDEAQLRAEMPDWTVRRMVMVGTAYKEWYYALRRLYKEGVKPDYVIVPPLPFQLSPDELFRGDYLPLHWMDRSDILDYSRRDKIGLTATSNLMFASYNRFFALRDDLRNALLGNLIPGHKVLTHGLPDKRTYKVGEVARIVGDHLIELQTLLAQHGAKLVILHYPAPNMEAGWTMVERVVGERNIPYVSAVDSIPYALFKDAYHLGPQGTQDFTKALGPALNEALTRLRSSHN
jgi:hypothetical protein